MGKESYFRVKTKRTGICDCCGNFIIRELSTIESYSSHNGSEKMIKLCKSCSKEMIKNLNPMEQIKQKSAV